MSDHDQATILIVDDDADHRQILLAYLELAGCTVVEADSGAAALAWLHQHRPTAMVLDLIMPRMSGVEVLEQVRRDPKLADLPVVVLSGSVLPEDMERTAALGVTTYLMKPFRIEDVRAALAQVIPSPGDAEDITA